MQYARHQIHAGFTQPPWYCNVCIRTIAFDLNCISAASFKPLRQLRRTSTSSYSRCCNHAAASRWQHAKEAEGSTRCSHCEGQHWDLRQLQWLLQTCVHAEGCSSTRYLGATFCAAQRLTALQAKLLKFNTVSEFSPFVPFFPLVPSSEGIILYVLWKNLYWGKILSQVQDQSWQRGSCLDGGRAEMGAGAGPVQGGGTCVLLHKNVRRNRLECSFWAVCQGENLYFSPEFSWRYRFPAILDFPLGKIPAKLRRKSCTITHPSPQSRRLLGTSSEDYWTSLNTPELDFSKYAVSMWHFSWYLTNFYETTDARNMGLDNITRIFTNTWLAKSRRDTTSFLLPCVALKDTWRVSSSRTKRVLLPRVASTNTWRASSRRDSDTTSFLLPSVAWRRPTFRRMVPLVAHGLPPAQTGAEAAAVTLSSRRSRR